MKFIKLTVNNELEADDQLNSLHRVKIDIFTDFLKKVRFVEFDIPPSSVSYLILNDYDILFLEKVLNEAGIESKIEDITNDVLLGREIQTELFNDRGESVSDQIKSMINDFYNNHITVDIILDKINQFGINSLSQRDKGVLES